MITDINKFKEIIYDIKGKSFESFRIVLAWEKIINQYMQSGMTQVEALAAEIMRVRGEADQAETYEDHLKKMADYKELRAKWEKYAPGKMIGIRIPEAR